ncbi:MAG TPA: TRAP transporter small permease [Xanthobacteraceae bacterium]|jgi:TRAP-type C4-dicarboxylate transport system permease small subunit|nr:TRAP transporter small permease [Xanthobacteraceae bacterium]
MLLRLIDHATRVLTVVSAAIIGALAFLVSYDAITRTLRMPTIWIFDVSLYLLIAAGFLGSAYALRSGSHFRMVIFADMIGENGRRWADRVAYFATFAFAAMMTWLTAGYALDNYNAGFTSGTILDAPLWIPQSVMPIGALVLALEALSMLIRDEYPDVVEG